MGMDSPIKVAGMLFRRLAAVQIVLACTGTVACADDVERPSVLRLPIAASLVFAERRQSDPLAAQFLAAIDDGLGPISPSIRRVSAEAPKPVVTAQGALPDGPAPVVAVPTTVDAAPKPDPLYPFWQERANARLRSERQRSVPVLHPLAAARPDDVVVVCEAGCRGPLQGIVNAIPKSEQIQISAFETTAAKPADADAPKPKVDVQLAAAQQQDPNDVFCLAGCYDSPRVTRAREFGPAVDWSKSAAKPRASFDGRTTIKTAAHAGSRQVGVNGTIVTVAHWSKRIGLSTTVSGAIDRRFADMRRFVVAGTRATDEAQARVTRGRRMLVATLGDRN